MLTDHLLNDITTFFNKHNDLRTLEHSIQVSNESKRIAEYYEVSSDKVIRAALLHDISNVIPITRMLHSAEELSIHILDDERKFARSVHQKLSKTMAEEIFGVSDPEILNAIESHTTHKPNATMTDKILFVSDKISWNLPGEHQYLQDMRNKVNDFEIDEAILIYLNNIWEQRSKLKLIHPWLIAAREELI
jgi:predicted HD superfamily hydrolase involved in NAD metabolism